MGVRYRSFRLPPSLPSPPKKTFAAIGAVCEKTCSLAVKLATIVIYLFRFVIASDAVQATVRSEVGSRGNSGTRVKAMECPRLQHDDASQVARSPAGRTGAPDSGPSG